jgi:hypothetical protein
MSGRLYVPGRFTSGGERPSVPIGRSPRADVDVSKKSKSPVPEWSGTADRTLWSLVTILTALPRLTFIDLCEVFMSMMTEFRDLVGRSTKILQTGNDC